MTEASALLAEAARRLQVAGVESPRLDARLLLARALGRRADSLVGPVEIPTDAVARFDDFIGRRLRREPVAYITGHKEFWSLDFEVGPGVLAPRPETETLIELALERLPDRAATLTAVDLGTGSGCLLAAFLSEYPNGQGVGVDVSADALVWAKRNIERLGLASRCRLELADWNDFFVAGPDVVFANPPYIASEDIPCLAPDVRLYEPISALDGGDGGLAALRSLSRQMARLLRSQGLGFIEIGAGQAEAAGGIFEEAGLKVAEIALDLAGIPRGMVVNHPPA
ncbi:MAG TPA: peptide chain release factor N(5)-glutamine methyltransferase [Rhizomicrobium sp.]|nr:peptide chain release factor N(5)-glutamine methyltransferase [Rhizomicrobium sp.]